MPISEWPTAPSTQTRALTEELAATRLDLELLSESYADLQLAAEDQGWQSLGYLANQTFTRSGLDSIASNCRIMAIASPLIKRGLALRIGYIWGEGVTVTARNETVQAVIAAFWDDESNQAAFTSSQAQEENERVLGTDGNFFLACFTNPLTGRVQVRSTPFEEIRDIIRNPEDRDEPWFYVRHYSATVIKPFRNAAGITTTRTRDTVVKVLHPALGYRPRTRPRAVEVDGVRMPVQWDAPMLHVPVNRLDGWKFGVGDAYASLPWARAYEGFLTDWAKLMRSLSKFAWRLTGDKASRARKAVGAMKQAMPAGVPPLNAAAAVGGSDAGQLAGYGPGATLEAIPKTGATIDSESGRPLAAMVAAGLGLPVTMLTADPGTTGARAVAETLDRPTRNEMGMRRKLWASVITTLTSYVVDQAIKAPQGPLAGTVVWDPATGREVITLAGDDTDRAVLVEWPDLESESMKDLVAAIVAADSTSKLPPLETARLLLTALGVDDIDDLLKEMTDENGNWIDPELTAAQAAVDAYRRGDDAAEALR